MFKIFDKFVKFSLLIKIIFFPLLKFNNLFKKKIAFFESFLIK